MALKRTRICILLHLQEVIVINPSTSIVEPKRLITLFSIVIFPSDITGSELNSILTCPRKYEALFVSEINLSI
jgi:predicted glycosyltransferase